MINFVEPVTPKQDPAESEYSFVFSFAELASSVVIGSIIQVS